MVDQPPAEVHVRAVGKALVKPADGVERAPRERQIERGRLVKVGRAANSLDLDPVVAACIVGGDGEPRGDALVAFPDGRDQPRQPIHGRPTARVDEHDQLSAGRLHAPVALVRNRDANPVRRRVVDPAHRGVTSADPVETAGRGVDDHDLGFLGFEACLSLDRAERLIQSGLVLADHDDGDHADQPREPVRG